MQEVTLLHTKLDKLLKKYEALRAENVVLTTNIQAQKDLLRAANQKVNKLEERLSIEQTGDVIASNNEDKAAVRKQLNGLIKDIDKLLATLND